MQIELNIWRFDMLSITQAEALMYSCKTSLLGSLNYSNNADTGCWGERLRSYRDGVLIIRLQQGRAV